MPEQSRTPSLRGPLFLTTLLLASPFAAAAEPGVVVPPFQSMDGEGDRWASTFGAAVEREIGRRKDLKLVPLERVPAVGGTPALDYAQSCPPGDHVGCAFVLGETADVSIAVSAGVWGMGDRARIEIHIVDVPQTVDVMSFEAEVRAEDEVAFATAVAKVVAAVAAGEIRAGGDIRAALAPVGPKDAEKVAAQRQLEGLKQEIGGSEALDIREDQELLQKDYTMEDLAKDSQTDGVKPWDRLGMGPQEYLRFKNSRMSLGDWRKRQAGRKGQILLRPTVGFGRGPIDQTYEAAQGISAVNLDVVETDAWQAVTDGSGIIAGASAGYGILPGLEVGGFVYTANGNYSMRINQVTEGQTRPEPEPQVGGNACWIFGLQALGSFFQTAPARPVVGGSVSLVHGTAVTQHTTIPSDLPAFKAPNLWRIGAVFGAEARLGDPLDLFVHVPLDFVVGGEAITREHTGGGVLTSLNQPPTLGGFGAGVLVGVQVRLLKPKVEKAKEVSEDPEEF